jgi:threonine/homoserine/homoserine lactone efflux protein
VLAALNAALYTAFASFVRQRLASGKAQRGLNVFGGLVLVAAGVWALLARSPAAS